VTATDALAQATTALRTVRNGGSSRDAEDTVASLETAGCDSVHVAPPTIPGPLELVLGRRPTA
jgi:hypothetical protein